MKFAPVACVALAVCGLFACASSDEDSAVKAIVKLICDSPKNPKHQISRISTISKVIDYFEASVTDDKHEFAKCKQTNLRALEDLEDLLAISNSNVCSDEKISKIEEFHIEYVSKTSEHVEKRKAGAKDEISSILRLFFMQYSMFVSAICRRGLINNIEWDLSQQFGHIEEFHHDSKGIAQFGNLFDSAIDKFTKLYQVNDFDDVVLFWNVAENSILGDKDAAQFVERIVDTEFDPATGQPVRLHVKVKSTKPFKALQHSCYSKFKPIYEKLILPIVRLADLGYSNTGKQFAIELKELRENSLVKHWYSATQLCEAVLPIKFHEDPSLTPNDVVMITRNEAEHLDAQTNSNANVRVAKLQQLRYEPTTYSLENIDHLVAFDTAEAQNLVKSIKLELSARDRAMKRAVSRLLQNLREQLKARLFKFSIFKRDPKPIARAGAPAENPSKAELDYEEEEYPSYFDYDDENQDDLPPRLGHAADFRKDNSEPTPSVPPRGYSGKTEDVSSRLEQTLSKFSDAKLLGGIKSTGKVFKGGAIERKKRRRRPGDDDMMRDLRTSQLSYARTKSWGEIWNEWTANIGRPSRLQLLFVGGFIIGLMFLLLISASIG